MQFFDAGYTAVGPKIPFTEFQELTTGGTIHLSSGYVLVIIAMDTYGSGMPYPFFKMIRNTTGTTKELSIGGKTYTYISNSLTFNYVYGVILFDNSNNMVMCPWSSMPAGWTEYSVLINSSFFSLKGISFLK